MPDYSGAGDTTTPYVVVLGNAQDGGYPQAGTKPGEDWDPAKRRLVSCLAIVDPKTGQRWLVEATPDFKEQLHLLDIVAPDTARPGLAGILVTHAHVGHYTGLINLGLEIIGTHSVPVFAMPRMREFLSENGPWDQLVRYQNIVLRPLSDGVAVQLNDHISVTPFRVPHRDEYSETVGFRISGPKSSVIFLPDIDKWERWDSLGTRIEKAIEGADAAYIDGTFYADGEIPGRNMADIPHPFIVETMRRFASATKEQRARIRFIHLNRTNPVATGGSKERRQVEASGFRIAEIGERVLLR